MSQITSVTPTTRKTGVGLVSLLHLGTVILLILQLIGVITVSYWVVFLPSIIALIYTGIAGVVLVSILVIAVIIKVLADG